VKNRQNRLKAASNGETFHVIGYRCHWIHFQWQIYDWK